MARKGHFLYIIIYSLMKLYCVKAIGAVLFKNTICVDIE